MLCAGAASRLWNLHMHILVEAVRLLLEEIVRALEQGRDVLERIGSKDAY